MFKVIIIDDEKTARRTLEKYCELYAPDFEVCATFSNGESAIEFLEENEVDVVFSDIKMPGLTGIDVAKWIYKNKPEIKVVIVSGYSDFFYAQEAIKCKVVYYLLKVVDVEEFKNVVKILKIDMQKDNEIDEQVKTETFFCDLLSGVFENETQLKEEYFAFGGILVENAMCKFLKLDFKDLDEFLKRKQYYNEDTIQKSIENIIRMAYDGCFVMMCEQSGNKYKYIILFDKKDESRYNNVDIKNVLAGVLSIDVEILENSNTQIVDMYKRNILSSDEKNKIINSQNIEKNSEIKNELIKKVIDYINDNCFDAITVNDITKTFWISRTYLSRQFKESVGKTVNEYIMDKRMTKAIELVEQNISTDEICRMIGYVDTRNFRRLFQRYTGKTIQEYKKKLREE